MRSAALLLVLLAESAAAQEIRDFPPLSVENARIAMAKILPGCPFTFGEVREEEAKPETRALEIRLGSFSAELRFVFAFQQDWDGQGLLGGSWRPEGAALSRLVALLDVDGDESILAAQGDVRTIATAAEAYAIDANSYPDADETDLWRRVVPVYVTHLPQRDPWGGTYVYRTAADRQHFVVVSGGPRGRLPDRKVLSRVAAEGGGAVDAETFPEGAIAMVDGVLVADGAPARRRLPECRQERWQGDCLCSGYGQETRPQGEPPPGPAEVP